MHACKQLYTLNTWLCSCMTLPGCVIKLQLQPRIHACVIRLSTCTYEKVADFAKLLFLTATHGLYGHQHACMYIVSIKLLSKYDRDLEKLATCTCTPTDYIMIICMLIPRAHARMKIATPRARGATCNVWALLQAATYRACMRQACTYSGMTFGSVNKNELITANSTANIQLQVVYDPIERIQFSRQLKEVQRERGELQRTALKTSVLLY